MEKLAAGRETSHAACAWACVGACGWASRAGSASPAREKISIGLSVIPLPEELQAHLADASQRPGAGDTAEGGTGETAAGVAELGVLEGIEELGAELHRHVLAYLCGLL